MRILFAAAIASSGLLAVQAEAATLDRIKETGVLTLGYRADAVPFSFENDIGEPAGYSVALCKVVAAEVKSELKLDKLEVRYVKVTGEDRFKAVSEGRIDLLCGATTQTLSRREQVDFSLPTFATGSTLLYRQDGPQNFEQLAGQKIGVHAGTTTESGLKQALADQQFQADLVAVDSHEQGVADLAAGKIAAYFGDGAILLYQWRQSPDRDKLMISDQFFSNEPYALALPKDDGAFRLAVDRALAKLYRSGGIIDLFGATFGSDASPSEIVRALYAINALPE
ncbi:amino acid ABC transporter substrate-binding protein [Geminicoccus roseus]|uniref:amino acid ABC transporter substrate-binding protein n=1 Tax=Geminicoccus roseus TaxID=404900 RepID=UPI000426EC60|nr:amino acid ABC transporter substrate-binding protein [Geminicoccus roseus]